MKAALIAFTAQGLATGQKAAAALRQAGWQTTLSAGFGPDKVPLADWTAAAFAQCRALVFVGAAGIAVRAVAPLVRSKAQDPAVLCTDEGGRFVIPLLSGHLGGANALARLLAQKLSAVPVVTTATDLSGVFAADSWARQQGFAVADTRAIKQISGTLLAGGRVGFYSELPVTGPLPAGLLFAEKPAAGLVVAYHPATVDPEALLLVPPCLTLGVGCRKGTPAAALATAFDALCRAAGIHPLAVARAASVDLKQNEPGLLEFCAARGLPLACHKAAVLEAVAGDFSQSDFVRRVTGTGCVCERAACAAGETLCFEKFICPGTGVTLALGYRPMQAAFGPPEDDPQDTEELF